MRTPSSLRRTARLAALAATAGILALPLQAAQSPFNELAGTWAGGGTIRLKGGNSERLSCRAYYTPKGGGAELGMAIRCASASYKIEMRSALHYNGGAVSGSWEERTFNAGGAVSGSAAGGSIKLSFSGNVSGSIAVTYAGSNQTVTITTSGTELSGVVLSLSRG